MRATLLHYMRQTTAVSKKKVVTSLSFACDPDWCKMVLSHTCLTSHTLHRVVILQLMVVAEEQTSAKHIVT